MSRPALLLRRAKFLATRRLSAKTYWYLMGLLRPVPAVTSSFSTTAACMASGALVVDLLDKLDVLPPESVTLHIGAGLGRVEYHLRDRVSTCCGIDISSSMVKAARSLVPFDNVEFIEGDGISLSHWPDGHFNLIYSFLVFQHLPRQDFYGYLSEAYAKLSSGGHLVFQMLIEESGCMPEPPPRHPYGVRYYRRHDVVHRLRSAGFGDVVQTDVRGEPDDASIASGDIVFRATKP